MTQYDSMAKHIEEQGDLNDFNEIWLEQEFEYDYIYPRILQNSFLVTVYAYLEEWLGWFYETVRERGSLTIGWQDLHGDMLGRARTYLEKLGGISFPADSTTWEQIRRYQQLRNCLVHQNGRLQEDDKKLRAFARTKGLLSGILMSGDILFLTKEFCEEVLSTVRAFLNELHESLSNAFSASGGAGKWTGR